MFREAQFLLAIAYCGFVFSCTIKPVGQNQNDRARADILPGVKIIYSANLDGEIEPCGCRETPIGGLQRRWNLLEQELTGEKLSVESGDLFYKSAPVPHFLRKQWDYQAEVLLRAYNFMKIDAMQPGELDFAAGLDQFQKLREQANFPMICANLYWKDSKKYFLEPYLILKRGQKKIGIFGLYDENLPLPPELVAKSHLESAKKIISELRGQVDLLFALTHLGLEKDRELARMITGIDAIFGAHTQSFLVTPEKINDTFIFQTSFRGQHLGMFTAGENAMYQMDARFDSPPGKRNKIDELIEVAKKKIAELNQQTELEIIASPDKEKQVHLKSFQTFTSCAACHAEQFQFHKKTAHFHAFETLVKAKQNSNLDCLKCHTLGMQEPGGWKHVTKLVLNSNGKELDPVSFAKSAHQMPISSFSKISKAFLNVQCESCHGSGGEHPFSGVSAKMKVNQNTCLGCHTPDRAPGWYNGRKPNLSVIQAKFKSLTCPKSK